MKRIIRKSIALLVAFIGILVLGNAIPAKAFNSGDTYKITVIGGYAVSLDGKVITEAKYGDSIIIYPESTRSGIKTGEFVKGWKSDIDITSYMWWSCHFDREYNALVADFAMPNHDIVITAVTERQKPYIIDLTYGHIELAENEEWIKTDESIINKWICQSAGYYEESPIELDLDLNGTKDVCFVSTAGHIYSTRYEMIPLSGCNITGDVVLDKPNYGPYWPITIRFGDKPIQKEYTVTINGGTGYAKPTDEKTNTYTAKPGTYVSFFTDYQEGYYVKEVYFNGDSLNNYFSWYYEGYIYGTFLMPAHDVEVTFVREKQTPFVIDFTKGYAEILNEIYDDYYPLEDLNRDGKEDLCKDYFGTFWVPSSGSKLSEYTLNGPNNSRYCPVTFKFGDTSKDYSVQVNGGHAEDENGNVITKAKCGQNVRIIRDKEPGKYWKAWKSDYPIDTGMATFMFRMPARDVTFTAETTTTQISYTLDLTKTFTALSPEERYLIGNAIEIFNGQKNPAWYSGNTADIDKNGEQDFRFGLYDDMEPEYGFGINRLDGNYTLGTKYTVTIDDGQIGTLTFVVDNTKTDWKVVDRSQGPFTVTLGENVDYTEMGLGVKSKKFYPGEYVYVYSFKGYSETDYIPELFSNDIGFSDHIEVYRDNNFTPRLCFYMPYHNVTIQEAHSVHYPLELDLRSGSCIVDVEDGFDFARYFGSLTGIYGIEFSEGVYEFDMDSDGRCDLEYNSRDKKLTALDTPYMSLKETIFVSESNVAVKYLPLTIYISDNRFYHIDYKLYTSSNQELWAKKTPYPIIETADGVTDISDIPAGTVLTVNFYKNRSDYNLVDYYYEYANVQCWVDKSMIVETDDLISIKGFVMPQENVTFVGIYKKYSYDPVTPTATPTVTPTPVPTENVTPSLEPTETPDNTKDSDSDGLHPFTLLIAGIVLCMIGVGIFAVISLKRMKDKSDTPE